MQWVHMHLPQAKEQACEPRTDMCSTSCVSVLLIQNALCMVYGSGVLSVCMSHVALPLC